MAKFLVILALLALITGGTNGQMYLVQNFDSVGSDKYSISFSWDNPTVSYSSFLFNYTANDDATKSVPLASTLNTYTISGLVPGSEVHATVSTVLNGQVVATTSEVVAYTALAPVTVLKAYEAIGDRLQIYFEMPEGLYERIDLYAYDEAGNQYTASVSFGQDYITIISLPLGNNITFGLLTATDAIGYVLSDSYIAKTGLDTVAASYDIISYKQVRWGWTQLNGLFDVVIVNSTLLSNSPDAARSFISNSSLQTANCKPGYKANYELTFAQANQDNGITLSGLCPLSVYEVKFTVSRDTFDSTTSTESMRTDYQNVDCELVTTKTVGNKTTFTWPFSKMYVDVYNIDIFDKAGNLKESHKLNNTNNKTHSIDIYGLDYNTQYVFAISVKRGRFNSVACKVNVETGDPCPYYDDNFPVKLNIAPYVYNVSVIVSPHTFLYQRNIVNYTVIVGTDHDCSKRWDPNTCYQAFIFDADQWDLSGDLQIDLSIDVDCQPSKVPCNVRFVLDKNFYVSFRGWSYCGPVFADVLIINIPTPFPLGVSIGVAVGVSLLVVVILLAVIIVITFLQIRKRNNDEATQRLVGDSSSKYEQQN